MVDDRPEDTGSLPGSERPKRAPPTIDLEATEVSTTPRVLPKRVPPKRHPSLRPRLRPRRRRCRPWKSRRAELLSLRLRPRRFARFRPGHRAGLRRGRGRAGDRCRLDAGLACGPARVRAAAPQLTAAVDDLTARVAGLEVESRQGRARSRRRGAHRGAGKIGRRAAQRTHSRARARREARVRPQRREIRAARDGAAAPDLSAINERLAKVESADAGAERRDRAAGQQDRR